MDLALTEFGRVSGFHVIHNQETERMLEQTRVRLSRPMQVPPAVVYSVTENILKRNDYALTAVHHREPRILWVTALNSGQRRGLRSTATAVPEAHLHQWADHPAFLISTVAHLPNTDVRALANSLRTLLTDVNTQQIVPLGSSNMLLIMGFGADVHALVQTLTAADKATGEDMAARSAAARGVEPDTGPADDEDD